MALKLVPLAARTAAPGWSPWVAEMAAPELVAEMVETGQALKLEEVAM